MKVAPLARCYKASWIIAISLAIQVMYVVGDGCALSVFELTAVRVSL